MSSEEKVKLIKESQRPERSVPRRYFIVCMLGLLLFTTGLVTVTGSRLIKEDRYDYYGYHYTERSDLSEVVQGYGVMLAEIGIGILITGLLAACFLTENLTPQTRTAFLGSSFGLLFLLLIFTLIYGLT
jgi:hypothetical protein